MKKLYHVKLTDEERKQLNDITSKGKAGARKMNRARVLLLADDGKRDQEIRDRVGVKASFVERTRQRFAEGGSSFRKRWIIRERPWNAAVAAWREGGITAALPSGSPKQGHDLRFQKTLDDTIQIQSARCSAGYLVD
jgi:hypothetical protein